MMLNNSTVYRMNRIGSIRDPSSKMMNVMSERRPSYRICCILPDRDDRSQSTTVPPETTEQKALILKHV